MKAVGDRIVLDLLNKMIRKTSRATLLKVEFEFEARSLDLGSADKSPLLAIGSFMKPLLKLYCAFAWKQRSRFHVVFREVIIQIPTS